MTDSLNEFVDQIRRLIAATEDRVGLVSTSEEARQGVVELGRIIEEGGIRFTLPITDEHQRTEHTLDSRLFQDMVESQRYQLLDAYCSHAIYLCDEEEIEEKITDHMQRTQAYSYIENVDGRDSTNVRQRLKKIIHDVTSLLDDLHSNHSITDMQYRQMYVDREKVRMDYLFYLTDLCQKDVPFQPIMVCSLGPTMNIARYLSRLLQPIYDQVAFSTTFFTEADAVYALETYANRDRLLPETLFATIHLHDLCTTVPHYDLLQALERFLQAYYPSPSTTPGMTTDTIRRLVRVVLQNQFFVFKEQIYRQVKGGSSESPLILLLINIYLFYWQEDLVRVLTEKNRIYGRCFDTIFLTWSGSKRGLRSLLQMTVQRESTSWLQMTSSIGRNVNYLDVQFCHVNGQLQAKIHHQSSKMGARCLPMVCGHPHLINSTLLRAALIRAVLCCPKMIDFDEERHNVEDTFRHNDYAWEYIIRHVEEFFREFHASSLNSRLDQDQYEELRRHVIDYDREQKQMQLRQHQEDQHTEKIYLFSHCKGETLAILQENIQDMWKNYLQEQPELSHISIEIMHQPKYPSQTK